VKFFLDTANLDELGTGVSWGIVDGVTSAEAVETESGPMIKQGRELAKFTRMWW
jgi:hypothetical protein